MIEGVKTVHLIGIGGVGVSGVARMLLAMGHRVTGSDVRESQLTEALRAEGAEIHIGHSADYIDDVDLVIYSTAVPETNPELVAARERGLRVEHRSQGLAHALAAHDRSVGVVGTHGKGTVSSMITWILETAGQNPSFIIGGLLENFGKINSRMTDGNLAIAEVDESDGSLRHVSPHVIVVNNLEADHLNYYDSLEHVQQTVVDALNANPNLERVIVNHDDPGARAIIPRLNAPVVTFGRTPGADYEATQVTTGLGPSTFTLVHRADDVVLGEVMLTLPGLYNLDNALAAATLALTMGVSIEAIARAMPEFKGLENRFTVVDAGEVRVVKDYISHPTGIRRVLEAASSDGKRIIAVFKPYRFTMINYLQDDYAEAFHDASETVITELYTAGEVPIPGIDTEFLCDKIRSRGPKVTYIAEMERITTYLHEVVKPGEQVLFFGGDDLFSVADAYVDELRAKASS